MGVGPCSDLISVPAAEEKRKGGKLEASVDNNRKRKAKKATTEKSKVLALMENNKKKEIKKAGATATSIVTKKPNSARYIIWLCSVVVVLWSLLYIVLSFSILWFVLVLFCIMGNNTCRLG